MMRERLRRHPTACFLAVTFAVTWGAWLPLAIRGAGVTVGLSTPYLVGLCGPLVGALVTTAIVDGSAGIRDLVSRMIRVRVGSLWWMVALGLPLLVGGATYVALAAYSMFLLAPVDLPRFGELGMFNGFPIANPVALWGMLVVIDGYGEETGWRGFLLPRLSRRVSPLAASAIVGVVWALWHVPAFWVTETYRQLPAAMIPMFFIGLLAGSVFLAWLYNRGRQSIALVAVWHGTFNLLSGSVAARGAIGAVETAVVMLLAVAFARELYTPSRRRRSPPLTHHAAARAR